MSTFGALNTAYTGLVAARLGLDVVGQNITNANTDGYTRQRVSSSGIGAVTAGRFSTGVHVGQGVSIDGIARLADARLDARVRGALSIAGFSDARATALSTLEKSLNEPGTTGISAQLGQFWAAWGELSNRAGEPASESVLLQQASVLVNRIASGSRAVQTQWSEVRGSVDDQAAQLNAAGAEVAELNARIRSTLASGGSANELQDQRSRVLTTIAGIAGGRVEPQSDGTVTVYLGGNALVTGDSFRPVTVLGSGSMATSATDPVRLEWAHHPGIAVELDGGSLGGALTVLAPSEADGTGGALAETAASYDALALSLATQVNAIHRTGATADGTTGHDFFVLDAGVSAAQGLRVIPTDGSGIATGTPGAGGSDGSIADAISGIAKADGSPDDLWSGLVTRVAVAAQTEIRTSALADLASSSAVAAQQSNSAVDLDEENMNMLAFQRAYQGAARVMTAIDEALDTLINRTGLVGR
ncbi:flagellar biosynthesis protein FlgK [Leifsonia sp. Leaf325]|nr:flagellar hook-associated protein FlgK [Leifsonia sp. Leaf325]KQQ95556.1 flagellar biosynthesis protein FlgK [Leifsonia sp. Leaf325]